MSIVRKSSALMPPSPTMNADFGLNFSRKTPSPLVFFSALLLTSMATTAPFLRSTKSTSLLRSRQIFLLGAVP